MTYMNILATALYTSLLVYDTLYTLSNSTIAALSTCKLAVVDQMVLYCKRNCLVLNVDKTGLLPFKNNNKIMIGKRLKQQTNELKFFVLILDTKLHLSEHINKIVE